MKRKLFYWTLVLLLSLGVTILVQFLFREYRLEHLNRLNYVGKVEFVFTVVVLPIYLASIYFVLNRKCNFVGHFPSYTILSIVSIIISSQIDFINWWDTEGKIISANDAETRDVIEVGLILQFIIAIIVCLISLFLMRSASRNNIYTTTKKPAPNNALAKYGAGH